MMSEICWFQFSKNNKKNSCQFHLYARFYHFILFRKIIFFSFQPHKYFKDWTRNMREIAS